MFLSAEEPITVEVKRRSTGAATEELPGSPKRTRETASVGVQTEDLEVAPNLLLLDDDENAVFDESPVSDQVVNIFDELVVPDVDFEVRGSALASSNCGMQMGSDYHSHSHCMSEWGDAAAAASCFLWELIIILWTAVFNQRTPH